MKTMLTICNQLLNFFYKFQRKLDFSNRISRIIFKYCKTNQYYNSIIQLFKQKHKQITLQTIDYNVDRNIIEPLIIKNIAIQFRNNYIPTLNLIQELKIQMINFQFIKQQDFIRDLYSINKSQNLIIDL
ncbi:unnamed protein product [Paramecium sonneborni]|uniref:Uncharacterized protein n=1 Tax=Paramecium sonneborni TaxID=65129 RepID=A0A8S1QMF2_9CILI|nr:unnamed protein product [Paramecium sonneborni]